MENACAWQNHNYFGGFDGASEISEVFTVSVASQERQGTFKMGDSIAKGIILMNNWSETRHFKAQLTL